MPLTPDKEAALMELYGASQQQPELDKEAELMKLYGVTEPAATEPGMLDNFAREQAEHQARYERGDSNALQREIQNMGAAYQTVGDVIGEEAHQLAQERPMPFAAPLERGLQEYPMPGAEYLGKKAEQGLMSAADWAMKKGEEYPTLKGLAQTGLGLIGGAQAKAFGKAGKDVMGAGYSGGQRIVREMPDTIRGARQKAGDALGGRFGETMKPAPQAPFPQKTMGQLAEEAEEVVSAPIAPKAQSRAMGKVISAIKKDHPDNWREVSKAWAAGDEALIETYGQQVTTLGQGAAQYPGGKGLAKGYYEGKVDFTPDRLYKSVSENVSDVENYYKTADDVVAAGKAKAAKAYPKAYDFDMASDRLAMQMNDPIVKDALKGAIELETIEALADGRKFDIADIGLTLDKAGNPVTGTKVSTKAVDTVKRGLDKLIDAETNDFGEMTPKGRSYTILKQSILDEADILNPRYKEARAVAGDYIRVKNAMREGRDFFKKDSELLKRDFDKLNPQEKIAFQMGVGKRMREMIDLVPEGVNPYRSIFGNKAKQKKLRAVLGEKEYFNLEKVMKAEDRLYKQRNEVLGNSTTTEKQIAKDLLAEGDLVLDIAVTGGRMAALKAIRNKVKTYYDGLNDETAKAVSQLIYETDPRKKVKMLEKYMTSREIDQTQKEALKRAYFNLESEMRNQRAIKLSPDAADVLPGGRALKKNSNAITGYHGSNAHAYVKGEIDDFITTPESGRGAAYFSSKSALAKSYGEKLYTRKLNLKKPLTVYGDGKHWGDLSGDLKVEGIIPDALRKRDASTADEMARIFNELEELEGGTKKYTAQPKIPVDKKDLSGLTLKDIMGEGTTVDTDAVAKVAKKLGYDGVIFKDIKDSPTSGNMYSHDVADTYAVFDTSNIDKTLADEIRAAIKKSTKEIK